MKVRISKLLNKFNASKDAKVLTSNFSYLMILQVAGYIFPLITLPYLARVIGVEGFGKIAFAVAVIVWFQTITEWGFNYTATRDLARNRDNPDMVSEIFSNVLWSKLILMSISFMVLFFAVTFIPYFNSNKFILLITFLIVPSNIFYPEWFFQAIEKMKFITIFNLLSKFFFTILVFVFIKEEKDYIYQPLFISLGSVLSGFFAMYLIVLRWNVLILKPDTSAIIKTIKDSSDIFLNNIMPNFYNGFSIILLGFFGGVMSNGLLDAGSKLVGIAQQFIQILSRVFFPLLSRKIDKHDFYFKINFSVSVLFCISLFFSAPLIIKYIFTPEFNDAILVLQIMSFSIVFISLSNIYGLNYMVLKGHEKKLRNITFVCSLVGFLISFPLIIYLDYLGAAITITLTRGLLGISVMYNAIYFKRVDN